MFIIAIFALAALTATAGAMVFRRYPSFATMKRLFLLSIGFLIGALVIGVALIVRDIGQGLKSWDRTEAYSDVQVRQEIRGNGILIPAASWNLFYAINGFQDHGVWITFTVPKDQLWPVVETSLHRAKSDFTNGIPDEFLNQVEMSDDQKVDTSLWTPEQIKHPLHYSIREKGQYFEDWVVDEEEGRVFITKSNL